MHIDSEVHFWKYEKSNVNPLIRNHNLLAQTYLPEQFSQSLHRNGMDGCIAAVAEPKEVETRFLSELAATHREIKGVVGWIDLYDPKSPDKIKEFQQYASIRGYQIETAEKFPEEGVMEQLLELGYSLDISTANKSNPEDINKWIRSHPDQVFILSDCAHPDAKHSPTTVWEKTIRELSSNQNLCCKVSGLFTSGNLKSWKPADFYPFLDILFEAFGPERLLFASDWPFLLITGIYVQWKSLLEKFTEKFTAEERDLFFGENARRIYRL
jgi:L-fuconolactonase